jgi:hypothetical protein
MQQQKPQGFLVAGGIPPAQGSGRIVTAVAARTRAAEQMAFEDVWKALNPDFRTPFASVEDAISRCVRAFDLPLSLSWSLTFLVLPLRLTTGGSDFRAYAHLLHSTYTRFFCA